MSKHKVVLDGLSLTLEDVIHVARDGYSVQLSEAAEKAVQEAAARNSATRPAKAEFAAEYGARIAPADE